MGDLLLTIDGRLALDGLLSHKDGAYAIELQRGESKATLTVPMTELVP